MVRTRSSRVAELAPVPHAITVRGRGCGKGQGWACAAVRDPTRVATIEPLVAPIEEKVLDHVEPVGTAKAPEGPIATPRL